MNFTGALAVLFFVLLVLRRLLVTGFIVMLTFMVAHDLDHRVPPIGFWLSVAIGFLISFCVGVVHHG